MATCLEHETQTVQRFPIMDIAFANRKCVLLKAENGAVWAGSVETPFTLRDGRTIMAPEMDGEYVATDQGDGTEIEWSRVNLFHIGEHEVAHVNLGGRTFACGLGKRRVFSHNMAKQYAQAE